jgi:hypothetical protein
MSCCGKARSQAINTPAAPPRAAMVLFEYTGRTGLTIIGPGTRTSYRFDRPGARAMVDARDRASLASVPVLRQVSY